jgi:hypothetical protein
MTGNAVPPLLATALGHQISAFLDSQRLMATASRVALARVKEVRPGNFWQSSRQERPDLTRCDQDCVKKDKPRSRVTTIAARFSATGPGFESQYRYQAHQFNRRHYWERAKGSLGVAVGPRGRQTSHRSASPSALNHCPRSTRAMTRLRFCCSCRTDTVLFRINDDLYYTFACDEGAPEKVSTPNPRDFQTSN